MSTGAAGGHRLLTELRAARRAVRPPAPAELATGALEHGRAYRRALADLTDAALVELWADAGRRLGTDVRRGVALACVGSLGRRDGGPCADLDLVLLHDGSRDDVTLAALSDALWYPIWDAGLTLDHSVRTLADCRSVASTDVPAAVGLLGMRNLAGDADLGAEAASAVLADWRGAARVRLEDLAGAVAARGRRTGDLAHLSEPDLKECRGGLRDARIVSALAASWLTDRPHGEIDDAVSHLCDVRDALHVVTGRAASRLTLHDQDAVASAMGLGDRAPRTRAELDELRGAVPSPGASPGRTEAGADPADELLAGVSAAGRTIRHALDTTLRSARRAATRPRGRLITAALRAGRPPRLTTLAPGLVAHDGEVVLAAGADPASDPLLPLRAARAAIEHGLPLSPVTTTALARCPDPAGEHGRWPPEALTDLLAVLAAGTRALDVLDALDLVGVVAVWLPEWAPIRNRPQRTAVHTRTVDRHLLLTVAGLAELPGTPGLTAAGGASDPRLLLAALLHDLGKLPGERDHSARGARIADPLLVRLGVRAADRADIVHLVAEHLLLAETATGRDVSDPAVVDEVAGRVGSRERLHLLRALTEADARAAGPRAWTRWRAELVDRLTAAVDATFA
ncbi:HD domain-containing protein [Georgenia sp. Z1491]|uniref:[protein-PII] uridylyltransferase family protein n=1 Tax=Georgenia sp. Z1491 TaxID=3416707 RepID=UPI003CE6E7CA